MPAQDNIEVSVVRLEEQVAGLKTRVKLLASNVERMLTIQEKQEARISTLEDEPADNWKNIKNNIITAIISALVGGGISIIGVLASGVLGP